MSGLLVAPFHPRSTKAFRGDLSRIDVSGEDPVRTLLLVGNGLEFLFRGDTETLSDLFLAVGSETRTHPSGEHMAVMVRTINPHFSTWIEVYLGDTEITAGKRDLTIRTPVHPHIGKPLTFTVKGLPRVQLRRALLTLSGSLA